LNSKKRFPVGTIEDPTVDLVRVWNISFTGYYYANKAFLPLLQETKDSAQALVCTSSASAHWISTEFSPISYNLSKFALNQLVETIQDSHHKDGIVVYALRPGAI
jgi:NAD(P)-dependent dehydrogenase (short-subunit alcohol dehydrogenase family)